MLMHQRRREIAKKIYQRRCETIDNLAKEFGVSRKTVIKDINALRTIEPFYLKKGKDCASVYVLGGGYLERAYMTQEELDVLKQLYIMSIQKCECVLDINQQKTLQRIILDYTSSNNHIEKGDIV